MQQTKATTEALESMMMYLADAVSKDCSISIETAKPRALEIINKSCNKLLGLPLKTSSAKSLNKEQQTNMSICIGLVKQLRDSGANSMLLDSLEFHLKKLKPNED